jgi:hypothetical protein
MEVIKVRKTLRCVDLVPMREARRCLTALAADVVDGGAEKLMTKNGSSCVAIVDAKRLDCCHALEAEHANLALLE